MDGVVINPFDQDAFNMVSLTSRAINILPNMYGRVNTLNLMPGKGVRTRTIIVEEKNGELNILQSMPVGAPGQQNKMGKRKVRTLSIPHFPLDDVILPEEYEGIRVFGQESQIAALEDIMNDHLQTMRNKHAITLEYLRMGALKGIIYEADLSVLYNLYTQFEIVAKTVDFALDASPITNVQTKCFEVKRHIEENLMGEVMSRVHCLCDAAFFDALIGYDTVKDVYKYHQGAVSALGGDPRSGFTFGGITFEEYGGTATDAAGNARPFIAAGEGHCFPVGTMNAFGTRFAPADFVETANTMGIELYAKQELRKFGRGIDVHTQSNPLPLCFRPAILVKVTM